MSIETCREKRPVSGLSVCTTSKIYSHSKCLKTGVSLLMPSFEYPMLLLVLVCVLPCAAQMAALLCVHSEWPLGAGVHCCA